MASKFGAIFPCPLNGILKHLRKWLGNGEGSAEGAGIFISDSRTPQCSRLSVGSGRSRRCTRGNMFTACGFGFSALCRSPIFTLLSILQRNYRREIKVEVRVFIVVLLVEKGGKYVTKARQESTVHFRQSAHATCLMSVQGDKST